MGSSSTESNVLLVLSALEILLAEDGFLKAAGKGVGAAQRVLAAHRDSRAHAG
jgi:aspartate aminotransferase-like enzyme